MDSSSNLNVYQSKESKWWKYSHEIIKLSGSTAVTRFLVEVKFCIFYEIVSFLSVLDIMDR